MTNLDIGAAYIRVSTDEQTELSPDAQLRVILEQAKKDGVTIPPEFIFIEKKGISGRRAENRPEFPSSVVVLGKFRCFHVPALFCDSFLPRFSPYLQKIFYAL